MKYAGFLKMGAVFLASGFLVATNPLEVGAQDLPTLTVVNGVEVPTFDPQAVLGIDAIVAVANMYDRLVYLDADGEIIPWLATSWELSDDNRTWTFKLRDDARFRDGSPVNAAAVKFSFERATGEGRPASLARTYLSPIESVEAVDDYTVRIVTKQPFGPLLKHLGHQTVGVILNPAVVNANNGELRTAIDAGSGMYRLVSWERNKELVLELDPNWWGEKPGYGRVVYKPVPQISTRVIMLENGEVDVVTNIPNFEVARLGTNQKLSVKETQSIRSMYFAFNFDKEPSRNLKLRQAINHAINVDGIVAALMEGHGSRATSILTPNLEFYSAAYDFDYDVEKAKAILAEAGIAPGTKIVMASPQGRWPLDAEIAQAVAGNIRDIGLDVDLRIIGDWAQYLQTLRDGELHLSMFAWAPGSLDADGTLSSVTASTGANNYGKYKNDEVDGLIRKAAQSVDPAQRSESYAEVQRLIGQDVPYLLLQNSVSFSATSAGVCGIKVRSDEAVLIKDARPCGQ